MYFSSGCLEHIMDPLELLNESFKSLNDNGLFASVPNSDAHFKSGSIEDYVLNIWGILHQKRR